MFKRFIVIIFAASNVCAQWFAQQSNTIYPLKSVYCADINMGWICGSDRILTTTNSGLNWTVQLVNGKWNSIFFIDNMTGWVCGDSGKVGKTTNAGITWQYINSGTSERLNSIKFLNAQTGLIGGNNKIILKTTDSGLNWISLLPIGQPDILAVKPLNDNIYFASGVNSSIFRSTNAGATWNLFSMNEPNPLFAIAFIDNYVGWATGCCGMFLKTTNGGENWENLYYLTLGYTLYSMHFVSSQTGFVSGDGGIVYRTTNQGESWDSTVTNTDQSLYSVYMVNENTGWVVGNYGTILKTTNGGGQGFPIGINNISTAVPEDFKLYQNFPNPFNPTTKIKFDIKKQARVKLKILDILGNELSLLINETLTEGSYIYTLNFAGFSSGIYFYKLQTETFSDIKKFVFIK
ncbi:MAG TPA: YCF48-related protein [Ignavibacteria bacterium]|jgi:photosystem II stability/assembly factor-like uncharacterized protein